MNKLFTYSILQYRHSQAAGEVLNVGLVFHFPGESRLLFVAGNTARVKAAYPGFDTGHFNAITRSLKDRLNITQNPDLFDNTPRFSFRDYLYSKLIGEDSTALQFSEPVVAVNSFSSHRDAIEAYNRIFLPDFTQAKLEDQRHSEHYLLKKCTDYITRRNINIDHRMTHNRVIHAKKVKLNFDLSWRNHVEHLVKPISFDLLSKQDIQDKSVRFFGYLNLLSDYAKLNECSFDLLIARPQDPALQNSYNDALETLQSASAPMEVIPEEALEDYSERTAEELHKKDI